jgi:hypothetical protein
MNPLLDINHKSVYLFSYNLDVHQYSDVYYCAKTHCSGV